MGNCIETCRREEEEEEEEEEEDHDHGDNDGAADVAAGEESGMFNKLEEGAMRIKIVLTREELQWLMLQLNNNGNKHGEKRLQEALQEIERARSEKKLLQVEETRTVWKPVLDSIMEVPEVSDQMN